MKRWLVNGLAVIVLTSLFMKLSGSVQFTDSMTDALVQMAQRFHVYGDEAIEDFYLLASALVSLMLSLLIVGMANVARTRRARRS